MEENYGYLFVSEWNNAQESHTGQCLLYFVVFVFVTTVSPLLRTKTWHTLMVGAGRRWEGGGASNCNIHWQQLDSDMGLYKAGTSVCLELTGRSHQIVCGTTIKRWYGGSVLQMGIPTGFPVHCLTQDNQIYLSKQDDHNHIRPFGLRPHGLLTQSPIGLEE